MDAIETAIRNAFEKGDAFDPAYRQRVYRSAIAAVEKALEANRGLTPEAAERRRDDVRRTIQQIETEFVPAVSVAAPAATVSTAPAVDLDMRSPASVAAQPPGYDEPRLDAGPPRRRPDEAASVRPDVPHGGGRRATDRDRSLPWRLMPVAVVILLAGAAIWWAASNGLFRAPEANRAEAPAGSAGPVAPPESSTGGQMLPDRETPQDWITVFSPADPTQVSAPANASAEIMEDESGRFMRVRSGSDGAPVSFGIGQGILERIAGRSAVFNIVARVEEGMPTEISVECEFGGLGDCGRKRYQVNYERGDFLFDVELPEGTPESGGAIAISSDVENAGKAVDIYEIRVSVNE